MKRLTTALALTVLAQGAAHADESDVARALAATCTGCHGTGGASLGPIPSIAGMDTQRMILLLRQFRDGTREATIMHQLAKGYTDAQIQAMAGWFASQKR